MEFRHDLGVCEQHAVDIEDLKIQRISHGSWILYVKKETILNRKCDNDLSHESLRGTYIVTINDSCETEIGNIHLKYHQSLAKNLNYQVYPITNLPELKASKPYIISGASLKDIDLDETKELSQLVKVNKLKLSESASIINVKNISKGTIILYAILVLIFCIVLVIKYYKKNICIFRRNNRIPENADNFALGEGRVMHSTPHRVIEVRA